MPLGRMDLKFQFGASNWRETRKQPNAFRRRRGSVIGAHIRVLCEVAEADLPNFGVAANAKGPTYGW
jgi:hypothetical protein